MLLLGIFELFAIILHLLTAKKNIVRKPVCRGIKSYSQRSSGFTSSSGPPCERKSSEERTPYTLAPLSSPEGVTVETTDTWNWSTLF